MTSPSNLLPSFIFASPICSNFRVYQVYVVALNKFALSLYDVTIILWVKDSLNSWMVMKRKGYYYFRKNGWVVCSVFHSLSFQDEEKKFPIILKTIINRLLITIDRAISSIYDSEINVVLSGFFIGCQLARVA